MKHLLLSGLSLIGLALAPGMAQAGCADFASAGTGLSIQYDPFSNTPVNRILTLRVSRVTPSATSVRFIVVDPNPAAGASRLGVAGPEGYDIAWTQDASQPVFFHGAEQPNATNGAVVSFGSGPSGDVVHETFRLSVPAGQSVGAGDYYEPLEIRYVCYSGNDRLDGVEVQSAGRVAIDLETPEMISAWVGSVGNRRGEIDLGVLGRGQGSATGGVVITAQSTSPYEISVGAKWGVLRRSEADATGLPYSMRLGGLSVERGDTVVCDRTPAPSGRSHALQIGVNGEDVMTRPAGAYSDVVTLTFAPRLGLAAQSGCSAA
ncbi:MAG: hypothetical protein ACK4JY_04580 [Brevundimonas sp.]|uniref:hypothetical protein n=1 Tax=Brevundimonas sp. TaxID=1871086 RepID=UPI00391A0C26